MQQILQDLKKVERLANASRLERFWANPFRYAQAILFRQLVYPTTRTPAYRQCKTFFGQPLTVALPAGTDIYLTGGKTHPSEIRLARFLIHHLAAGDHVMDIGAHFGYFTLLAAHLVGKPGRVMAFEASTANYRLLQRNTASWPQVISRNQAVSDREGSITFYQFPMQFSEYNSREVAQYEHETWFSKYPPQKISVPAVTIDSVIRQHAFGPKIIKIDVEGGELQVIKGGQETFTASSPTVVMEYLSPGRNNEVHQQAYNLLRAFGYAAYVITAAGGLLPCDAPDQYLQAHGLDSDNLVFRKKS